MAIVSEPKSWTLSNENGREDNNKESDKNRQEAPLSSAPRPPHGVFLLVLSETHHHRCRRHHSHHFFPFMRFGYHFLEGSQRFVLRITYDP